MKEFNYIDELLKVENSRLRQATGLDRKTDREMYATTDINTAAFLISREVEMHELLKRPQTTRNRYKVYFVFPYDSKCQYALECWNGECNLVQSLVTALDELRSRVRKENKR